MPAKISFALESALKSPVKDRLVAPTLARSSRCSASFAVTSPPLSSPSGALASVAQPSTFLLRALSGFLVAAGASALGCAEAEDPGSSRSTAQLADADEDGFTKAQGDCDDFNNTVYPGALEHGADGMDSNCDGSDTPVLEAVWATQENVAEAIKAGKPLELKVDALAQMDADHDGTISLEEFNNVCAQRAMLVGKAREGIVQFHASCAGTNACRGMVLQSWGVLGEHSCRGSNSCTGWSCVETAEDEHRTGVQAYAVGHCGNCHTPEDHQANGDGTVVADIKIPVQPSRDPETYLADFWSQHNDDYLRSLIAFGVTYIAPNGYAVSNMPGAYTKLNRKEIDALILHLRTLSIEGAAFVLPGLAAAVPEPTSSDAGAGS